MKNIETTIIINAPASMVWDILTDFDQYVKWNPFIHTNGEARLGAQLENTMTLEGQKPQVFRPTITEYKEGVSFKWLGSLFVKGLFDGEHYFQLELLDANTTKLIHGENFSGILSGIIMNMIGEKTLGGFEKMNKALKERSEKPVVLKA